MKSARVLRELPTSLILKHEITEISVAFAAAALVAFGCSKAPTEIKIGGVGPLTIAMLLKNTLDAAGR